MEVSQWCRKRPGKTYHQSQHAGNGHVGIFRGTTGFPAEKPGLPQQTGLFGIRAETICSSDNCLPASSGWTPGRISLFPAFPTLSISQVYCSAASSLSGSDVGLSPRSLCLERLSRHSYFKAGFQPPGKQGWPLRLETVSSQLPNRPLRRCRQRSSRGSIGILGNQQRRRFRLLFRTPFPCAASGSLNL